MHADEYGGITIETANVTGWGSLLPHLEATTADVVCVQEHKVLGHDIAKRRETLYRKGWRSIWAPALATEAGGISAGVAIVARRQMGLWTPEGEQPVVVNHRVCSAMLSASGLPSIMVYAAYLHDSEGPTERNCGILEAIDHHKSKHNLGWVVGADFNMEPKTIADTGLLNVMGGRVAAGPEEIGTCTAATPASSIDYFIVDSRLQSVLSSVSIVTTSALKTHRPVQLKWKPNPQEVRVETLKVFRLTPTRVFGPLPKPLGWNEVIVHTRRLWKEVSEKGEEGLTPVLTPGEHAAFCGQLNEVYKAWNSKARCELADVLGVEVDKTADIGEAIQTAKYSIFSDFREGKKGAKSDAAGWTWVHNTSRELLKASKKCNECAGIWATKKERGLKRNLLAHTKGILNTGPRSTPFETAEVAKKGLKDLKGFARTCRSKGLNPQGWDYFGDLDARVVSWEAEASEAAKKATKERSEQWLEWVDKATLGGAKAGHSFIKNQPKWRASTTSCEFEGGVSGRPCDILSGERKNWSKVWDDKGLNAKDIDDAIGWSKTALPRLGDISPEAIRVASASFKENTAVVDGWHPRHFGLLSNGALWALANILNTIELLGEFPEVMQNLLVALIEKDTGGHRPIGLFRALFRVWAKIRKKHWTDWEDSTDPDHMFGAGTNRGATDLVWRQAFRNEVACADDEHALSVLIDLAKCYEHVKHILLAREATKLNFPMVLLRITIRAYAWARKLTLDKRVCEDVMPSRGIIAGCASATSELKAVMYRACSKVIKRNPAVNISIFIDDLTIDGQGNKGGVTEDVVEAAHDLIDACQDDLMMPIAMTSWLWWRRTMDWQPRLPGGWEPAKLHKPRQGILEWGTGPERKSTKASVQP